MRKFKPIERILKNLSDNLASTDITLFPPASVEQLAYFERQLKFILPDDLKKIYLFSNGIESTEDLFRIIPWQEIIEHQPSVTDNSLYVAEYMIYSDMWRISVNPSNPQDYWISCTEGADKCRLLTKSLSEFLERFLSGGVFGDGSLHDWRDEID